MVGIEGDIRTGAARVAGIYLAVAVTWIVLTDLGAVGFVLDPIALTGLQTVKGLFFVTASAGLLYVLIAREQRRLAETNEELELTLRHASVLHRLLRHNLRNSCDVIRNNVALLRRGRCDETEAAYERIERQTEALVDIAEKSRHLRDAVLADEPPSREIDLRRVVRDRAAVIRAEFPDADVTVTVEGEAVGLAHPRIGIAIEELLRNGIVHASSDHPEISAAVRGSEDEVRLEVTDEGPGLPETERAALGGTLEDPLEHSRGIGLWLVQFLVTKSGGRLAVRENDPSGTIVEMVFDRPP